MICRIEVGVYDVVEGGLDVSVGESVVVGKVMSLLFRRGLEED